MGRIIGMGFFVLALWAGVEFATKGPSGAFGGLFAKGEAPVDPAQYIERTGKAADAFQRAYDSSIERTEKALEE